MKKFYCLFFVLFIISAISVISRADAYEWYTVKDNISAGINFRTGPSKESEVLNCMLIDFKIIHPLLMVVDKTPNGWLKARSNRNGTSRNIDYQYKYFYVAGWLLRKVDLEKEKLAILQPADYDYNLGIDVHPKPHVFSYSRWKAIAGKWKYIYPAVKMSGIHIGPFMDIIPRCCREINQNFVLKEFFGFKRNGKYKKYSTQKILFTRDYYLDGGYYYCGINAREKPSILNKVAGKYGAGRIRVIILGEQGDFYLTSKSKWIFKQCLVK